MSPIRTAMLVAAAVLAMATEAAAVDVYVNGVLVTGVRNQEFEGVTVRLDSAGDVRITAPHYRVERLDATDSGPAGIRATRTGQGTPPGPAPTKVQSAGSRSDPPPANGGASLALRYWLVAESSSPGNVQYRIEVRVNGLLVRSFDDAALPPPVDITEYLRPGRNTIRITADKINEGGRRSTSSRDWLRVVVSDGHVEGTAVVIDGPGIIFTRNAAQTDRVSTDHQLEAR